MPTVRNALVAHFDPDMRLMLRDLLADCGVRQLRQVRSSSEAFVRLQETPADLLICSHSPDLGEDGLRLLRRVRREPGSPCPTVPVLVILARASWKLIRSTMAEGADGVLTPPLTRGAVEARLRDLASRPRVFVRTANYVGPCRRRRDPKLWSGPERRRSLRASEHTVSLEAD